MARRKMGKVKSEKWKVKGGKVKGEKVDFATFYIHNVLLRALIADGGWRMAED
jgi:hypothetical protein